MLLLCNGCYYYVRVFHNCPPLLQYLQNVRRNGTPCTRYVPVSGPFLASSLTSVKEKHRKKKEKYKEGLLGGIEYTGVFYFWSGASVQGRRLLRNIYFQNTFLFVELRFSRKSSTSTNLKSDPYILLKTFFQNYQVRGKFKDEPRFDGARSSHAIGGTCRWLRYSVAVKKKKANNNKNNKIWLKIA